MTCTGAGLAAAQPVGEIGREHDDRLQPAGDQVVLDLGAMAGHADVKYRELRNDVEQAVGLGRRLFDHHRQSARGAGRARRRSRR